MQTVDAKYDVEYCPIFIDVLLLVCSWFIVDAHISMSIKLKHPTIAIVRTAAVRRRMFMSLKRLLIRTIESEKYCRPNEKKSKLKNCYFWYVRKSIGKKDEKICEKFKNHTIGKLSATEIHTMGDIIITGANVNKKCTNELRSRMEE